MASNTVFLSYSSVYREVVSDLRRDLENAGFPVWIDHTNIMPGTDFAKAIELGIQSSQIFVYIASPEAKDSPNVAHEYLLAKHYNLIIRVFWVAGQHWLGAALFGMGQLQYIDARTDYSQAVQQLLDSFRERTNLEPTINISGDWEYVGAVPALNWKQTLRQDGVMLSGTAIAYLHCQYTITGTVSRDGEIVLTLSRIEGFSGPATYSCVFRLTQSDQLVGTVIPSSHSWGLNTGIPNQQPPPTHLALRKIVR